ncbi:unnamed protein product [Acanthosepion pharaonis]|uniref:Uncharacterized protein n=1 Tax=Acanthosepion pharaonis TaxID=158019 RepID=A0A812E9N9_ACAPH|nr:unnamed protein product [Sepia pharaonis]
MLNKRQLCCHTQGTFDIISLSLSLSFPSSFLSLSFLSTFLVLPLCHFFPLFSHCHFFPLFSLSLCHFFPLFLSLSVISFLFSLSLSVISFLSFSLSFLSSLSLCHFFPLSSHCHFFPLFFFFSVISFLFFFSLSFHSSHLFFFSLIFPSLEVRENMDIDDTNKERKKKIPFPHFPHRPIACLPLIFCYSIFFFYILSLLPLPNLCYSSFCYSPCSSPPLLPFHSIMSLQRLFITTLPTLNLTSSESCLSNNGTKSNQTFYLLAQCRLM